MPHLLLHPRQSRPVRHQRQRGLALPRSSRRKARSRRGCPHRFPRGADGPAL